jgi:hypothetical protein
MASDPKANEGKHICDIRNVRMAHKRTLDDAPAHRRMQASTYIFYDEKVIISLQISTGVTCVIAPLCMQVA